MWPVCHNVCICVYTPWFHITVTSSCSGIGVGVCTVFLSFRCLVLCILSNVNLFLLLLLHQQHFGRFPHDVFPRKRNDCWLPCWLHKPVTLPFGYLMSITVEHFFHNVQCYLVCNSDHFWGYYFSELFIYYLCGTGRYSNCRLFADYIKIFLWREVPSWLVCYFIRI